MNFFYLTNEAILVAINSLDSELVLVVIRTLFH